MVVATPALTPLSVFYLFGVVQAVFLALALMAAKKSNRRANRYLALMLIVFGLDLFNEFLDNSLYGLEMLEFMVITFTTDLLYGPLVWLYVRCITGQPLRLKGLHPAWLFVPWAVHSMFIWPRLQLVQDPALLELYPQLLLGNQIQPFLMIALVRPISVVLTFTYLILSLRALQTYAEVVRDNFSYKEGVELKWLRRLLVALLIVFAVYVFWILFSDFFQLTAVVDVLLNISIVVVIYALGFFGIRQPLIFSRLKRAPSTDKSDNPDAAMAVDSGALSESLDLESSPAEKYAKSSLSTEGAEVLARELGRFMREKQPYLNNDLNLPQLASLLGVSANHLSQVINEQFSMNFFDFINRHRIEAAKQQLLELDPKRYTILGLALDSGFNSKSAFYTAFKKYTGITPLQFRDTSQA